jgi:hypothetical protein
MSEPTKEEIFKDMMMKIHQRVDTKFIQDLYGWITEYEDMKVTVAESSFAYLISTMIYETCTSEQQAKSVAKAFASYIEVTVGKMCQISPPKKDLSHEMPEFEQ